jgi:anti-sigma B factor antagonist
MPAADEPLTVALTSVSPVVVLTVRGDLDAHGVDTLRDALDSAIRDHDRHVVIDARQVGFVDSSGMAALVGALRRLNRTRRRLAIVCERNGFLRSLELSGLHHTFDCHPTVEAAIAVLGTAPRIGR